MSDFTDEELRRLGEEYLKEHPDLVERYLAEKAKERADQTETTEVQDAALVASENEEVQPVAEDNPEPEKTGLEAYKAKSDELIAIVYPVSWPSPTEDVPNPHSTLIFLGPVEDATFTKDDLKAVLKVFIWEPFDAALGEVKMFTDDDGNDTIPVVTLLGEQLYVNRQTLEEELGKHGIKDASEHEYSPHITVDPVSMQSVPLMSVRLGKPQIWWGTDRG